MPLIYFAVSEAVNEKFHNMTSAFKTLVGNNNASLIQAVNKLRDEVNKEPQITTCKSILLLLYYHMHMN